MIICGTYLFVVDRQDDLIVRKQYVELVACRQNMCYFTLVLHWQIELAPEVTHAVQTVNTVPISKYYSHELSVLS